MHKFEVYQSGKDHQWYWRLKYDNRIIGWSGEGHGTQQEAVNEAGLVRNAPSSTPIYITDA